MAIVLLGFCAASGCGDDADDVADDSPCVANCTSAGEGGFGGDDDADCGGCGGFSVPALLVDDTEVTMSSPAEVPARRQALIEFLWGPGGLPSEKLPASVEKDVPNPIQTIPIPNLARVDRLLIEMGEGVANETFHFVPQNSNGRLVIVHQGHGYTLDVYGLPETIAALVARGYGVLGGMMPCYSAIPCPGIPQYEPAPHNLLVDQVTPPEGDVLQYFVEHLVVSLNYLRTQSEAGDFASYNDFAMTGLSGGGWTTVLYAAIDPAITLSVPCSGSWPMYLRHCSGGPPGCHDGYANDAEQRHFPLYKHVAGYLDLYAMGGAGTSRKQVQVQIRHDSCCFGEDNYGGMASVPGLTWNEAVRAYEQKVQQFLWSGDDHGSYQFEIDETSAHKHVISPTTLARWIVGELDGDWSPVGAASADQVFMKGPYEQLWSGLPDWTNTGFPAVGTPAVVESAEGTDVLARDASSRLIVLRSGDPWMSEAWSDVIASDPAAVRSGDRLDAVAVGGNSRLVHWSKEGSDGFLEETPDTVTPVVGTPVLLASAAGLDVFVRRIDGGMQHVYQHGVSWATERVTDAVFRGFPSVVLTADGNLRMYARAEDGTLMEAMKPLVGGAWNVSSVVEQAGVPGTVMAGSPSAVVDTPSGDVIVHQRLPSGDLGQLRLPGAGVPQWEYQVIARPGGAPPTFGTAQLTLSPIAVAGGVFALSQEGGVWFHSAQTGWSWIGSPLF